MTLPTAIAALALLLPATALAIPFDPSYDGPHEQSQCTIQECRYSLCYRGIKGAWGYYATQDKDDKKDGAVLITYIVGHGFPQGYVFPKGRPYKICTNDENLLQFYGKDK